MADDLPFLSGPRVAVGAVDGFIAVPPLVRAGGGHPAPAGLPVLGWPGGLFCQPVLGQVEGLWSSALRRARGPAGR